jgi:HTH-type transcriptional repressor of puuD
MNNLVRDNIISQIGRVIENKNYRMAYEYAVADAKSRGVENREDFFPYIFALDIRGERADEFIQAVLKPDEQAVLKPDERERIGARILSLRKGKGFSQRELAKMTGLTQQSIARIELGRVSTGLDILSKIAEALDCEIDFVKK